MNKFLAVVVLTSMLAISGLKAQSERHRVGTTCATRSRPGSS
jgi:hypothetical protein